MRNGKFGALALGLGLAVSVAAPAAAQDFTDPETFGADFLSAVEVVGISEATEEVFENAGLEDNEETSVTFDITPLNPVDQAGSVITEVTDDVTFDSEVVEE